MPGLEERKLFEVIVSEENKAGLEAAIGEIKEISIATTQIKSEQGRSLKLGPEVLGLLTCFTVSYAAKEIGKQVLEASIKEAIRRCGDYFEKAPAGPQSIIRLSNGVCFSISGLTPERQAKICREVLKLISEE